MTWCSVSQPDPNPCPSAHAIWASAPAYSSPNGIEVLSGPRDKWLAGILLQSAQAMIKDAPVKDCTGYLLKTPDETYPALAINGQLTEAELHKALAETRNDVLARRAENRVAAGLSCRGWDAKPLLGCHGKGNRSSCRTKNTGRIISPGAFCGLLS